MTKKKCSTCKWYGKQVDCNQFNDPFLSCIGFGREHWEVKECAGCKFDNGETKCRANVTRPPDRSGFFCKKWVDSSFESSV